MRSIAPANPSTSISDRVVTHQALEEYRRDGATLLKGALDPRQIALVTEAFEYRLAHLTPWAMNPYQSENTKFVIDLLSPDLWKTPIFQQLWRETELLNMAGRFFSTPEVWWYHEQIFLKEGVAGASVRGTPWHQDLAYEPMEGRDLVQFWISLDPVEKGKSLEFVRGSHNGPLYNPIGYDAKDEAVLFFADDPRPPQPNIEAERSKWDIISWAVEPGDIVAFHPGMLHGGGGTSQNGRRRTLIMLFFGRDVHYAPRPEKFTTGELGEGGQTIQKMHRAMFSGLRIGDPVWQSTAPRLA